MTNQLLTLPSLPTIPRSEFAARLQHAQALIQEAGLDALLLTVVVAS